MAGVGILIGVVLVAAAGAGYWIYVLKAPIPFLTMNEKTNGEMIAENTGAKLPVVAEEVAYFEEVKGLYVRPTKGGPYPGVVMIHENRGLRPEIRDAAESLAKEGYAVLAVNLLGGVADDQAGAKSLTSKFDQKKGVENMRAATAYLREKGAPKVASWGWCFGGRQSVELSVSGEPLDATVVYYGGGMATTTERLAPIKWPVLGIFGDKDQAIPVETVRIFEASLDTLGVPNEIHIYSGVGHAFANPSGMNYAPAETQDAWDKTIAFLNEHLK